jgi:hypothetical protein
MSAVMNSYNLYLPEFIYFRLKAGRIGTHVDNFIEQECKQILYDYINGDTGYQELEKHPNEETVWICDIPVRVFSALKNESEETEIPVEDLAVYIIYHALEDQH